MFKKIKQSEDWKQRKFRWAVYYLLSLFFVALFSPFIANDLPLISKDKTGIHFPLCKELISGSKGMNANYDWKNHTEEVILFPPIVWKAGSSDIANSDYISPFANQYRETNDGKKTILPFRFRHFLGTDLRGADVLADVIQGARISLTIALVSACFAAFIGIFMGGLAEWFGNDKLKCSVGKFLTILLFSIPVLHIFLMKDLPESSLLLKGTVVASLLVLGRVASKFSDKIKLFKVRISIPLDAFILRITELMSTYPKIVLILVFAGLGKPSWGNVILILSLSGWTEIGRVVRAEFLRISHFQYIDAARLSGANDFRIIFYHILMNALPSIIVTFIFSIVSNVLIESGLSFLGFGVPPDVVTWGSLLSSGKEYLPAWWLIILPGMFLAFTIASLQTVAETYQNRRN